MKPDINEVFASWPKGVCHRGYHDLTRPENSRAAFLHAMENDLPFECDVHLTKDGHLLISHDDNLLRATGKEGKIENLDLETIKKDYRLFDGDTLMTLDELYLIWKECVPLVLELKSVDDNYKALAEAARKFLAKIKDPKKVAVICFDARALRELKDTDFNLGLLIGDKPDLEFFRRHSYDLYEFDFIDLNVFFLIFPMFRKYRKKGGKILTWTVRSEKDYIKTKKKADCPTWEVIRSNLPLEGQQVDSFLDNVWKK